MYWTAKFTDKNTESASEWARKMSTKTYRPKTDEYSKINRQDDLSGEKNKQTNSKQKNHKHIQR